MMWLVEWSYYEDHAFDSVWYSQANAQKRADELNSKIRRKYERRWEVTQVRVGDELE